MTEKLAPSTRHQYHHNGRVVYEWDQSFSEVNIYVPVPPGVTGKQLFVDIETRHLRFGIKSTPAYLDVRATAERSCLGRRGTVGGSGRGVYGALPAGCAAGGWCGVRQI